MIKSVGYGAYNGFASVKAGCNCNKKKRKARRLNPLGGLDVSNPTHIAGIIAAWLLLGLTIKSLA